MSLQYATALMLLLCSTAVPVYSRKDYSRQVCGSLSGSICSKITIDMTYFDGCNEMICNKGQGYLGRGSPRFCPPEDESNPRHKEYCDKVRNKFFWAMQKTPLKNLWCKGFDESKMRKICEQYREALIGKKFTDGCYAISCTKDGFIKVPRSYYNCKKEEEGNPRHKKFCDDIRFKFLISLPQDGRGLIPPTTNLQKPSAVGGGPLITIPRYQGTNGQRRNRRTETLPSFIKFVCNDISFEVLSALCRKYLLNLTFSDGCSTMKCRNGNHYLLNRNCAPKNNREPANQKYCERVENINFMVFRWNLGLPKFLKSPPNHIPNFSQAKCMGIFYNLCLLSTEMFWDGCNVITCDRGRHYIATGNQCPNETTTRHMRYCLLVRKEYNKLRREAIKLHRSQVDGLNETPTG